jgi:type IV pilus assembly protein PilE
MRRTHMKSGRSEGGFTLIELMIVVAVVAVLAAIVIPSYRQHTMKSNRAAAEAFMQQVANRQEQYVLNARIYATNLASLNLVVPANVSANYNINLTVPSTSYYAVTAVPVGGQVNDKICTNIALDQAGTKGAQCTVDTNGNVQLNTSTTTGTTMQCVTPQTSVCW